MALIQHFNTSHVNVNRLRFTVWMCMGRISIHLMLMLIAKNTFIDNADQDFNTSHVNVNLAQGLLLYFL